MIQIYILKRCGNTIARFSPRLVTTASCRGFTTITFLGAILRGFRTRSCPIGFFVAFSIASVVVFAFRTTALVFFIGTRLVVRF
jgi:hypothetical protein